METMELEAKENLNVLGSILATQYEIVRLIFSHLPMKDLEVCGKV